MSHVMPPDHIRAVGETSRMFVVGRPEQQGGGVDCSAGDDDDVRRKLLALTLPADNHLGDSSTEVVGGQFFDVGVGQQRYVGVLQCGIHGAHLRIGFGRQQARKPSHVPQRMHLLKWGTFSSSMTPSGVCEKDTSRAARSRPRAAAGAARDSLPHEGRARFCAARWDLRRHCRVRDKVFLLPCNTAPNHRK